MNRQTTRQQQVSTQTFRGRSLFLMRAVAEALAERPDIADPKVLSFGCSEGAECLDLLDTVPGAEIVGCDVNAEALAKARAACGSRAVILESGSPELLARAPFDAVFALSVFCRYPQSEGLDDVSDLYPFDLFDEGMRDVDCYVRPGGYLILFNTQYFFEDSQVVRLYEPFAKDIDRANGFIEKSLPDGRRATDWSLTVDGQVYGRDRKKAVAKDAALLHILQHEPERADLDFTFIDAADAAGRSNRQAIWVKRGGRTG